MGGASRRIPQVLKMNLGRGKVIKEHDLARIEGKTTEHGQMWTYHSWAQWMRGSDWDTLRDATNPPDFL
jgi:3-phenylpropionate/trans-cinnamate dioxygenase alpha subunit